MVSGPGSEVKGFSRYLTAVYLSLCDYAVEFAHTDMEKVWVSFQHVLYEVFMAYLTGVFAGEIVMGNVSQQRFNEKMGEIREFMSARNVPQRLRRKVMAFYDVLYKSGTIFDEEDVLADFPPRLRRQVVDIIFEDVIKTVPFFRGLDDHGVYRPCLALRPMPARVNEVIYEEGDDGREMYVVSKGMCKMYTKIRKALQRDILQAATELEWDEIGNAGVMLHTLAKGSFFGEHALVSDAPRKRTVIASINSELQYLTKDSISELLQLYPELGRKLKSFAQKREKHEADELKHVLGVMQTVSRPPSPAKGASSEKVNPRDYNLLEGVPMFAHLSKGQLKTMHENLTVQRFEKDEPVVLEGDVGHEMFIIVSGKVEIQLAHGTKRPLHRGDYFGEVALVKSGAVRTATILAASSFEEKEGPVELICISREVFSDMMNMDGENQTMNGLAAEQKQPESVLEPPALVSGAGARSRSRKSINFEDSESSHTDHGVIGASAEAIASLEGRFDGLQDYVGKRVDALQRSMDTRMARLENIMLASIQQNFKAHGEKAAPLAHAGPGAAPVPNGAANGVRGQGC